MSESGAAAAPVEQELNGRRATYILVAFLVAQLVAAMFVTASGFMIAMHQGRNLRDLNQRAETKRAILPLASVLAVAAGGMAMLLTAHALVGEQLKDTSAIGAAWVLGSRTHLLQGLAVGIVGGSCALVLGRILWSPTRHGPPGPLAQMAMTPGLSQLCWCLIALGLAPLFEELLFRGVLYGGYRRSYGPVAAALLTTFLFVIGHVTELWHFPPAIIGITGLAAAALWLRLRSAAIGPAVATHLGYNTVVACWVIYYWTWFRR